MSSAGESIYSNSSNKTEDRKQVKARKPDKWEIDLIGNFVLDLYHRSLVTTKSEWCIKKSDARELFLQYANEDVRTKLKNLHGTENVGNFLDRCGFLLNTARDSSLYRIKYISLFEFRNNKLKELDNSKINNDRIEQEISHANVWQCGSKNFQEENYEIDEDEEKIPLEYQGTTIQQRVKDFYPTNMCCHICQEDFDSMDAFEEHVQMHGDDTDFAFLTKLSKCASPIFNMNYRLCKNSHHFCFEFETSNKGVVIEKIIIIQSRSYFYVHNTRVPYEFPKNGTDRFFVDSHLFTIHVEQPIVLIFHLENSKNARMIEQHHFMRSEKFPSVNFAINPTRLPNKKLFKPKFELADYFPPKEIQDALKDDFYHEKLMNTSNEFRDYIRNEKKLQPQNIGTSLNILLQIEDVDTIQEYLSLTQKDVKIRSFGDEYSLKLKPKRRVFLENILSAYDEIILTTRTDILSKPAEIMELIMENKSDIKRLQNTFLGLIQTINSGRISFKCEKKINVHGSYTVICRPSRLTFRYQYRSLQLLPVNVYFLKNFLFPTKLVSKPLSNKSLILYNQNINEEQLQAVRNIADGPRNDATYIIFGPPGTGKTTTVVESILQVLKKPGTKVLVTASSNSACDEVALRLLPVLQKLDYTRMMVRIYSRSCEIRAETIDDELLENSNMYNGQFYPDIDVLHEYRVVVCTLSVVAKLATGKFGRKDNGSVLFTHLFIDEVAASTEIESLMAITTILTPQSCLIISGDHKQLGPILQSKRAEELGLGTSLMDRLLARDCYRVDVDTGDYDRTIQTRLVRNYRSHPAIVNLFSGLYYNHSLEPLAKSDDVSLCKVWHKSRNEQFPIIFHAIYEPSKSDGRSHSLYNLKELEVVMDYVKDFMYFGINGQRMNETDIGVISPYKQQYKRIQEELNLRKWFNIETGSVETFQGKEKNIIIVSFVRSGTENLGFLDNPRRLNVTISRPKSLLILIGNPQTLSLNKDFEYIIRECQRNNTFIGSSAPKRDDCKKQTAENFAKSPEISQLLKNMQSLKVDNTNQNKGAEVSQKKNVRRRGMRGSRSRTKKNRNGTDKNKDNKDDENEDDDDHDDDDESQNNDNKPSTSAYAAKNFNLMKDLTKDQWYMPEISQNNQRNQSKDSIPKNNNKSSRRNRTNSNSSNNAKKGFDMRQAKKNPSANVGGKITKQHNNVSQKTMTDNNKNINKNKLDSIFDTLPQVPTTAQTKVYSKEQILQLKQQQEQYFHLQQYQSAYHNNPHFNAPTQSYAFRQPAPVSNPYLFQQPQQNFNSFQQQQLNYTPRNNLHLSCFRNNNATALNNNNNATSAFQPPRNDNLNKNNNDKSIFSTPTSTAENRKPPQISANFHKISSNNNANNATAVNISKDSEKYNKTSCAELKPNEASSKSPRIANPFENAGSSAKSVNTSREQEKSPYLGAAVNLVSKEKTSYSSVNTANAFTTKGEENKLTASINMQKNTNMTPKSNVSTANAFTTKREENKPTASNNMQKNTIMTPKSNVSINSNSSSSSFSTYTYNSSLNARSHVPRANQQAARENKGDKCCIS